MRSPFRPKRACTQQYIYFAITARDGPANHSFCFRSRKTDRSQYVFLDDLSDTALVPYAGGFLKVPIDKYEDVAAQIGLDLDKVHAESAAALDASVDATFRSM